MSERLTEEIIPRGRKGVSGPKTTSSSRIFIASNKNQIQSRGIQAYHTDCRSSSTLMSGRNLTTHKLMHHFAEDFYGKSGETDF